MVKEIKFCMQLWVWRKYILDWDVYPKDYAGVLATVIKG